MSTSQQEDKTGNPEPLNPESLDPRLVEKEPAREYEKSGLYPENGKPFRVFALLGWLAAVVVLMAVAAAILDFLVV